MQTARLYRWMTACNSLYIVILLINGPFAGVTHAQVQFQTGLETKNVLVLHAFEANVPVFVGTDKGLSTTLESNGISGLNQFFESLDLRRNPSPEYRKLLIEKMRMQYGRSKLSVIVTMWPEALEFVLKDCRDIFPDVLILALYLPEGFRLPKTNRRIIGHSTKTDILGTFEIALKLVPGAKRVYVVSGIHEVDKKIEDRARRELNRWETRLEFHYLSQMSFEDMLATISTAPSDSIILALVLAQDISGKSFTSVKVAQKLNQVSKAPIFGLLDAALGHGIVGGFLINFENIGQKAGELILDILTSAPSTKNLSNTLEAASLPMFDWRQLRRWNLNVDALPEGSIVQNRQFSLWELYHWHVISGISILIVQTLLISGLLVHRRNRSIAEKGLRESEKRLRLITNSLPALIAYVDSKQRYQFNNDAYISWFGITPADALGRTVREVVGEAPYQRILPYIEKALSGERVVYFEDLVLDSGRNVSVEAIYVPDLDEKDRVRGFYTLAMDVSERTAAQQESKRLEDELTHAARITTIGELAGALAHEINQPLSAIMSNAHAAKLYLETPAPDLEEVKEILDDIAAEDSRASAVIDRLRSLLKNTPPAFESVDLNPILNEVAGFVDSDAAMRNVAIAMELAPELPTVQGDRIQLQQVILNLFINAFDAVTEKPPGERQVYIRTWSEDSAVYASVADSGSGISDGKIESVFKPFFTTKSQGLGMGLSISRSIINRHSGRIWVENNTSGRGATFYICLPAIPDVTAPERL